MFRKITLLLALFLACFAHASEDNVLLWFFQDAAIKELDGSTVWLDDYGGRPKLEGRGEAAGKDVNALRISVTDQEGNKVYLGLSDPVLPGTGGHDTWATWYSMPDPDGDFFAGPGYASLLGLNLSDAGLVFTMELGYATFSDSGLTEWIVMAYGSDTLETLQKNGHVLPEELAYQGDSHWQAAMAVPEPTSGMLVLIGGALLALRRRRKDLAA